MQDNDTYTTTQQRCKTVYDKSDKMLGYDVTYKIGANQYTNLFLDFVVQDQLAVVVQRDLAARIVIHPHLHHHAAALQNGV
jgi:uncharacterized protein YcfJ